LARGCATFSAAVVGGIPAAINNKARDKTTKGRLLLVEGTLSTSLWKNKEDNPQIQISISADVLKFISAGKREGTASETASPAVAADEVPTPPDSPQDSHEDLPF
jgi:single-strand DNA-binding protein